MPVDVFVRNARTAPNPHTTPHADARFDTSYTCHMAVIHWAFMDLGDTQQAANRRLVSIIRDTCPACPPRGGPAHGSLLPEWYGRNFCVGAAAEQIPARTALFEMVNTGDVLVLPRPEAPMHTMVVVEKTRRLGRPYVYVRGFNNVGTLGTGQFLQYDNADRDIDRKRYWRPGGATEVFGNGGATLYRIAYPNFRTKAAAVRARYAPA